VCITYLKFQCPNHLCYCVQFSSLGAKYRTMSHHNIRQKLELLRSPNNLPETICCRFFFHFRSPCFFRFLFRQEFESLCNHVKSWRETPAREMDIKAAATLMTARQGQNNKPFWGQGGRESRAVQRVDAGVGFNLNNFLSPRPKILFLQFYSF